jgi:hypothetical protein
MGRVAYDRTLIRTGYRPYGMTNPFAAAQGLAGVSMHHGVFGPWRLSGELGQNTPFTPRGGYQLHGLHGAMLGFLGNAVPDGSIVVYTGKWTPTYTIGATDLISAVTGALTSKGLHVTNSSTDAGLTDTSILGMTIQPTPFNVQLQIQVNTGQGGFTSPSDVVSIVDHAVYTITGAMPLASSPASVQVPGTDQPVATGPAGPVPQPGNEWTLPSFGIPGSGTTAPGIPTWAWLAIAGVGALVAVRALGR